MFCILLSCLPRFSPSITIDLDNDHCTSLNNALLLILILILLCFSSGFVFCFVFCFFVLICFGFWCCFCSSCCCCVVLGGLFVCLGLFGFLLLFVFCFYRCRCCCWSYYYSLTSCSSCSSPSVSFFCRRFVQFGGLSVVVYLFVWLVGFHCVLESAYTFVDPIAFVLCASGSR